MSNLLKRSEAQKINYVPLNLETFLGPEESEFAESCPSSTEQVNPAPIGAVFPNEQPSAGDLVGAQSRANEIIRDAESRAAEIMKEAKEEGFRLGKEEGAQSALDEARREARAEVATAVAAFRAAASEFSSALQEALSENETEMLGLVLGIARLVLGRETRMDKGLIIEQIKRSLAYLAEASEVTVKLHPTDLKVAQSKVDKLVPEGKSMRLSIVADKSVERGGCLLECNRGTVDARISTQLGRIKAAFEKAMRNQASRSDAGSQERSSGEEGADA